MFKDMKDPLSDSGADPSTDEANQQMARAMGVSPTRSGLNNEPLPNPWAPSSSRSTQGIYFKLTKKKQQCQT